MDRAAGCRLRQELMLRLVSLGHHSAIPSRSCATDSRDMESSLTDA